MKAGKSNSRFRGTMLVCRTKYALVRCYHSMSNRSMDRFGSEHGSGHKKQRNPNIPMPDRLTAQERSAHMARITKTDTKPEIVVRRLVHSMGFRFRLHRRDLPGTPDLTFPRLKKIVFVHGCFWHQHEGCRLARMPKVRLDYWGPKLRRNKERDATARRTLTLSGWDVAVVWECEVHDIEALARRLELFLGSSAQPHTRHAL